MHTLNGLMDIQNPVCLYIKLNKEYMDQLSISKIYDMWPNPIQSESDKLIEFGYEFG